MTAGVASPHWRRLTELPAFQLPKIEARKQLSFETTRSEAPSTQRLEADSFVQGGTQKAFSERA